MKKINEYRHTNNFNIVGHHVTAMASIANHYSRENGYIIISLGHSKSEHSEYGRDYTIRYAAEIDGRWALVDAIIGVSATGTVKEAEAMIIHQDSAAA